MRGFVAALVCFVISHSAFAQTETSTTPTSTVPEVPAGTIPLTKLPNAWSYFVALQGTPATTGLMFAGETPRAWGFLSGRIGVASDVFPRSTADDLGFWSINVAARLDGTEFSTIGMKNYALIGATHYFPEESVDGSKWGFDLMYGIELIHRIGYTDLGTPHDASAFIELGTTISEMRTAPASVGGVQMRDGLLVRLGFKRYF